MTKKIIIEIKTTDDQPKPKSPAVDFLLIMFMLMALAVFGLPVLCVAVRP